MNLYIYNSLQYKMMTLNEDILSAIRNRSYTLKPTQRDVKRKRHLTFDHQDDVIVARVLQRRIPVQYGDNITIFS